MPRTELEGILVPAVTPFRRDGELDREALRICVRFWIAGGVSGLVVCGSNGEAPYLSREERKEVIRTVVDEANMQVPVIAGTGSMSTRETVELTRDAKDLGVDAALVVTPFYFNLSNKEMTEHYKSVLTTVDLPVILYSVPKFTGFHLDLAVIFDLVSEHENVIGVKDSGGSIARITEIIRVIGDDVSVFAGTADVTLPTLLLGGKGAVIAVANVIPGVCSSLYDAVSKGSYQEAAKLQQIISHVNEVLVRRHNQLAAIKSALNALGLPGGYPRRPALPLEAEERTTIEALLRRLQ
jgi:4-hydroxy-tetrahydrodipicolinate synthase